MKPLELNRRVGNLSEKLKGVPSDGIRIDFESFPELEKQLLRTVWAIHEKYGSAPPADVIEANADLIFKAREVIFRRVLELFLFVMPNVFGCGEIEEWYFKLHFYNFFADFTECLKNVRKWPEGEREEFLRDLKRNGMINRVFRVPRGPGKDDLRKRRIKRERRGDD